MKYNKPDLTRNEMKNEEMTQYFHWKANNKNKPIELSIYFFPDFGLFYLGGGRIEQDEVRWDRKTDSILKNDW